VRIPKGMVWLMGFGLALGLVSGEGMAQTSAETRQQLEAIYQELVSMYPPAKATADGTDLVTAGAVLVLQKDNLVMNKVDQPYPIPNVYKNGAIAQSGLFGALSKLTLNAPAGGSNPNRTFVTGEKFWVTKITLYPDRAELVCLSDPIQDQRYHALLRFPFPKGSTPAADDVLASVAEVVKVDAGDGGGGGGGPDQSATSRGAPAAAPATAETKTIAVGQSRDQVISNFGVPSKIVQLGKKEIDYFPGMKVTFVSNKVTDVE